MIKINNSTLGWLLVSFWRFTSFDCGSKSAIPYDRLCPLSRRAEWSKNNFLKTYCSLNYLKWSKLMVDLSEHFWSAFRSSPHLNVISEFHFCVLLLSTITWSYRAKTIENCPDSKSQALLSRNYIARTIMNVYNTKTPLNPQWYEFGSGQLFQIWDDILAGRRFWSFERVLGSKMDQRDQIERF